VAAHAQDFGRYRLISRLGRGGMAETWKAWMLGAAGVTRHVAIKRILPAMADDALFMEAFVNEARVTASLNHGNIVQVFDFGQVEGEYFLAMEYVHGRTLEQLLQRAWHKGFAALPAPVAAFLAIEMLRGLHYAHTRHGENGQPLGIVHRDVSPDNVLISFEGQTKIVDFGVAKARLAGRRETEPGLVKGKYLFFSPEQARGEPLDGRTDVYAMGVVLYRMLGGQLPFEGQYHTAMNDLLNGRYPALKKLNPSVPQELDQAVACALALNRDDRFWTALKMEEALRRYLVRADPEFSTHALKAFVWWTFEDALEQEGITQTITRQERTQIERWLAQMQNDFPPTTSPDLLGPTANVRGPQREGDRPTRAERAAGVPLGGEAGVGPTPLRAVPPTREAPVPPRRPSWEGLESPTAPQQAPELRTDPTDTPSPVIDDVATERGHKPRPLRAPEARAGAKAVVGMATAALLIAGLIAFLLMRA
jgi:eukaryotic-like serine/threonine-protein kinase